jgi:hypothetical protein
MTATRTEESGKKIGKGFGKGVESAVAPSGKSVGKGFGEGIEQGVAPVGVRTGKKFGLGAVAGLARAAGPLAAVFAGVQVFGFAKDAVGEASGLNESINALDVTYGKASKGVQQLGKESATSLGLSNLEFNNLAVRFSNFASTVAKAGGGSVVGTLDDLTTRASDFASVMNLEVNEAARLFQSGLAGESEPLRTYGIDLSAAAVEAYALANGIVKAEVDTVKLGTAQAKLASAQANLIEKQRDGTTTAEELQAATAQVAAAE